MTNNTKKTLKWVPYIYYPVFFNGIEIQALLDLSSKVNIITSIFDKKLSFYVQKIYIRV